MLTLLFRIDDEILESFWSIFPEYKIHDNLAKLDEDEMKSAKGKERWRSFIMPVRPSRTNRSHNAEPVNADPVC